MGEERNNTGHQVPPSMLRRKFSAAQEGVGYEKAQLGQTMKSVTFIINKEVSMTLKIEEVKKKEIRKI